MEIVNKKNVLLCVSGASGAIYAKKFIEKVTQLNEINLYIIFTQTAKQVWENEIGESYNNLKKRVGAKAEFIENDNFNHKFASGSNILSSMVVLPSSMGSLARIATGVSSDLICRIADVQLKERRLLVIVPRETPYSLIHLKNMLMLTEAGAIIAPASPSFYLKQSNLDEVVEHFVGRIMEIAKIKLLSGSERWRD